MREGETRGRSKTNGVALSSPVVGSSELRLGTRLSLSQRWPSRVPHRSRLARVSAFRILEAFGYGSLAALLLLVLPFASTAGARETRPSGPSREVAAVAPLREVFLSHPPLVTTERVESLSVRIHVVAAGETLFSIAERYKITPETIAYNNGLRDAGAIKIGDTLRIVSANAAIYVVEERDTVEGVASRFGVEPSAVMDANRLYFEPDNFVAGRSIFVPVPDSRYPGFRLKVDETRPTTAAASRPAVGSPATSTHTLSWPVSGTVSQPFSAWHEGVDITAPYGSSIVAADAGTVSAVGWAGIGGLRVCVRHDSSLETCYYHASAVHVEAGERVLAGQAIADVGMTGLTTGPHVHWEAKTEGVPVDPLRLLGGG